MRGIPARTQRSCEDWPHYELTGEVADYGKAELNGSSLAIKHANEKRRSDKYGYVKYDNQSMRQKRLLLAAQLASDGVAGVVGPGNFRSAPASYQIFKRCEDSGAFPVGDSE